MSADPAGTAAVATPTRLETLAQAITGALPGLTRVANHTGELTYEVPANELLAAAQVLRDAPSLKFEMCMDVCGVDYLAHGRDEWNTESATSSGFSRGVARGGQRQGTVAPGRRFAAVYHLLSVSLNQRLRLRVFCEDDSLPVVPSLTGIWPGVNWFEREAFDLYGIIFEGHPDLRRILTDYGFVGHPFRKDFPLIGNVEVRYDPEQKRVVYEPVSIEPRVLVPRVIRDDADLTQAKAEAADNWREN